MINLFLGSYIICIIVITIQNTIIIRGLKQFIRRKVQLSNIAAVDQRSSTRMKYQKSATRVIIFMNFLNTIMRIILLASVCVFRVQLINGIYYDPFTNIFRGLAYCMILWSMAADGIIFVVYDKNLKKEWRKFLNTDGFKKESVK